MKPYFSIIIPVYNVEKQLRICIESVMNQSFQDFEVILVDDGSKDASGVICDEVATEYSKINCYHKENGGLSDARNYGIEKSSGKYLLFIDSDDVIDKDFCKVLYEAHEKHNAEIVSTGIIPFYTYEELDVIKRKTYEYRENILVNEEILQEYFAPQKERIITHGLCMKSYRAELFNNLRFEKGKLHEDLFITYKLLDKCSTFVYVDLPYYYYYQNNTGSISNNYRKKNFEDETEALKHIINTFEKREVIISELIYFITYHYFYMVKKCYGLDNAKHIIKKDRTINKWIRLNVWRCNRLGIMKKFLYYLCAFWPGVYNYLKK